MLVELIGPYRDSITDKCVDEDLIRIALSRHRICPNGRRVIGHCRYTDESILLFHVDLSEREKDEIIAWTKELIHDHKQDAKSGRNTVGK